MLVSFNKVKGMGVPGEFDAGELSESYRVLLVVPVESGELIGVKAVVED
jgi:hypothetical protein